MRTSEKRRRLRPLRPCEIVHRTLHTVEHPGPDGRAATWTVEVDQSAWEARLFRDDVRVASEELPATLPVPGGRIEVDAGLHGVRRMHLVADDGREQRLVPARGTLEERRARLARGRPGVSPTIAAAAVLVLAVNLVLAVPHGLEMITAVPGVAARFGTFTSPVALPAWLTTTLLIAGVVAAMERAHTWRRNRILDAETIWTAF